MSKLCLFVVWHEFIGLRTEWINKLQARMCVLPVMRGLAVPSRSLSSSTGHQDLKCFVPMCYFRFWGIGFCLFSLVILFTFLKANWTKCQQHKIRFERKEWSLFSSQPCAPVKREIFWWLFGPTELILSHFENSLKLDLKRLKNCHITLSL